MPLIAATGKPYAGGVADLEPEAFALLMVQQYLAEHALLRGEVSNAVRWSTALAISSPPI